MVGHAKEWKTPRGMSNGTKVVVCSCEPGRMARPRAAVVQDAKVTRRLGPTKMVGVQLEQVHKQRTQEVRREGKNEDSNIKAIGLTSGS